MNVFQELHLRGIACTVQRAKVEEHIGRVGRAQAILRQHHEAFEIFEGLVDSELGNQWKLAGQCKALIAHDRIMRGEL